MKDTCVLIWINYKKYFSIFNNLVFYCFIFVTQKDLINNCLMSLTKLHATYKNEADKQEVTVSLAKAKYYSADAAQ